MEANSVFDRSLDPVPDEAKLCLEYRVPSGEVWPWTPISTRNDDWTFHYAQSPQGELWATPITARSFLNNKLQAVTQGYSGIEYVQRIDGSVWTRCSSVDWTDKRTAPMAETTQRSPWQREKLYNILQNRRPSKLGPAKSVDVTIIPTSEGATSIEFHYTPNYIPVYKGALTVFGDREPSVITGYDFIPRTIVQSRKPLATGRWPTQKAWVSALQAAGCTPTVRSELLQFEQALSEWKPEFATDVWDSRSWFVNVLSSGVQSVATI